MSLKMEKRVYVQWTFFHEPENGRASLCPVDIFFTSLKTEKRGYVQGTLIHEPENRKARLCPMGIDSRA